MPTNLTHTYRSYVLFQMVFVSTEPSNTKLSMFTFHSQCQIIFSALVSSYRLHWKQSNMFYNTVFKSVKFRGYKSCPQVSRSADLLTLL